MYFIHSHPYFNSYISFRQEYFSFRPFFCLIADIQGIIYCTITFPPLIISQKKIYYKTIHNVITVIPDMIRSAISVHLTESSYCSLHGFAQSCKSGRAFRVGFGFGPGSGLKLTKISGLNWAWDMFFVSRAQKYNKKNLATLLNFLDLI